ncbi:DEAD/DEAH box helicase [bacterium AH-315-I18]|nr:DEAD/DEAH box helicase [bacterium AH-315-I18]
MSESTNAFEALKLAEPLLRALSRKGYDTPTPIQAAAIPVVMEGKDVLGCAQTGTGKTAAFALPILHQLCPPPQVHQASKSHKPRKPKYRDLRALVLAPTRELAAQIHESFREYGHYARLKSAVIFGGVSQYHQVKALQSGVDILVATPGRLMDLYDQGHVNLDEIEILVLDEADRMLDMGFVKDIRRIITYMPQKRQNLLFSATMPKPIRQLADAILRNPVSIQVDSQALSAAETVKQQICLVQNARKADLLCYMMHNISVSRAIVFTRTKIRADRLTRSLTRENIEAEAIHSDKSQHARTRALARFKRGDLHVLVASDIAARGVDIDNISHVFNFDMPGDPETYVHRIGRTGRAGLEGVAITFVSEDDEKALRLVERHLKQPIEELEHPYDKPEFTRNAKPVKKRRARHPMDKSSRSREPGENKGSAGPRRPRKKRTFEKKTNVKTKSNDGSTTPQKGNHSANPKKKPKNNKRRPPRKPDAN